MRLDHNTFESIVSDVYQAMDEWEAGELSGALATLESAQTEINKVTYQLEIEEYAAANE